MLLVAHWDTFHLLSAHGLTVGGLRADFDQLLRQHRRGCRRLTNAPLLHSLGGHLGLLVLLAGHQLGHGEELRVGGDGLLVRPSPTVLHLLRQVGIPDEHHRFKVLLLALFGVLERFLKFFLCFVRRGGLVVMGGFFHRDVHVVGVAAS